MSVPGYMAITWPSIVFKTFHSLLSDNLMETLEEKVRAESLVSIVFES